MKQVFIQTFGCQMNERDSEGVKGMLLERGYGLTDELNDASVILLNTCSVRQHAEDRVLGRSGMLSEIKAARPETVIGLLGCMAQEHGAKFFRRIPSLDLVCGPGNLDEIPDILERLFHKRDKITAINRINDLKYTMDGVEYRGHSSTAMVNIMSGCDHKCTYCIVPMTRGIERSRPSADIVREIKTLVDRGYKDFLLLGQNVNCYGKKLDENVDFTDLLEKIQNEAQPHRIRFTTSHPKDASDKLFRAMRDLPSVCEHLHLPVQSGSSRILKRMKREHTREWYLERIASYKAHVPGGSLTTDIITGFCGETDEDFEATRSLMSEAEFDAAFIFKYSMRPGTPAARLVDDVPEKVKHERHQELLALQKSLTFARNSAWLGKIVEVLVEEDDLDSQKSFGRTREFKRIVMNSESALAGRVVPVRVRGVVNETLLGELL